MDDENGVCDSRQSDGRAINRPWHSVGNDDRKQIEDVKENGDIAGEINRAIPQPSNQADKADAHGYRIHEVDRRVYLGEGGGGELKRPYQSKP